jgi:hypothetical protein
VNRDRHETTGWILFVLSALGFIGSSIRSGDMLALAGSVFFLAACVAFLWPRGKR